MGLSCRFFCLKEGQGWLRLFMSVFARALTCLSSFAGVCARVCMCACTRARVWVLKVEIAMPFVLYVTDFVFQVLHENLVPTDAKMNLDTTQ